MRRISTALFTVTSLVAFNTVSAEQVSTSTSLDAPVTIEIDQVSTIASRASEEHLPLSESKHYDNATENAID